MLGGLAVLQQHRLPATALWLSAPINGLWLAGLYLALPLLIERLGITGPGGSGLATFGLCISAYGCTNLAATRVIGGRPLPEHKAPMIFTGKLLVGMGIARWLGARLLIGGCGLGIMALGADGLLRFHRRGDVLQRG